MKNKSEISDAQLNMRQGYAGGSIGVLVSGTVWLVTAAASLYLQPLQTLWILLMGGVLIHPLSLVLYRLMGLKTESAKGNPFTKLAMEGTLFMIFCMPLAYGLSLQSAEWFFLGMMVIIGGRYLTFNTLYGNQMYWWLGFALGASAYLLFQFTAAIVVILVTAGVIEMCFGLMLWIHYKKSTR